MQTVQTNTTHPNHIEAALPELSEGGEPVLRLDEVEVGYKSALLPAINLVVNKGEMWAIVGPNGCGKSTLLKTVLGFLKPVAGTYKMLTDGVAYVPQRWSLASDLPSTAESVIAGGSEMGWSFLVPGYRKKQQQRVMDAMRDTDTVELASQAFSTLSEGQKQRVLIARALVSAPSLLILDEPTSAMDPLAEERVFGLINELASKRNLAILVVSHHLSVVGRYASHSLFLDKDRQSVVAGRIAIVCEDPACVACYGHLLTEAVTEGCHDGHTHACEHDHG